LLQEGRDFGWVSEQGGLDLPTGLNRLSVELADFLQVFSERLRAEIRAAKVNRLLQVAAGASHLQTRRGRLTVSLELSLQAIDVLRRPGGDAQSPARRQS